MRSGLFVYDKCYMNLIYINFGLDKHKKMPFSV